MREPSPTPGGFVASRTRCSSLLAAMANLPPRVVPKSSLPSTIGATLGGAADARPEYRVEHPRWRVFEVGAARLDCDVAGLYGDQFVEFLQKPASAFLADGSEVKVHKGTWLPS